MPIWTLNRPPHFAPDAVATERGWEDPTTGEVLAAIGGHSDKAGPADIIRCEFDSLEYAQEDTLKIILRFNERVNVTVGATVEVSTTGVGGNFLATAAEQTATQIVEFVTTVPEEVGLLSIGAQSVLGVVNDATGTEDDSTLSISATIAEAAGTREIE